MANWKETMAERLALPPELAEGVPRVTLTGSRQLLIENHKGLLGYSDTCIEVSGGALRLRVRGANLLLRAMDREELLVSGDIFAVEVEGA